MSALGCASGPRTLRGYKVPQRQQVAIVIDISDQVNAADEGGGVATLADTVSDRLKEAGIDSQLYTSKYDHPHAPRVDLYVRYWHGVPVSEHRAAALGAVMPVAGVVYEMATTSGPNKIVVDCSVTLVEQAAPAFSRRFENTAVFLNSTNGDNTAAESAGNAIADAILTR
jgi:hypothetical protein